MASVAVKLRPVVAALVGDPPPIAIDCWDGSTIEGGPGAVGEARIILRSPDALRHLLWAPGELGLGRAYVSGALDIEGDIYSALSLRDRVVRPRDAFTVGLGPRAWLDVARAARSLGAVGRRPAIPAAEARLRGRHHSRHRDAAAIGHHYDAGNDFYALFLGSTMTYSCAYFCDDATSLDEAQSAKYDLVCRKLGLSAGDRLLDVGCGWGGMAIHAASHHGANVVGITISRSQADLAAKRVAEKGVADRVEIRVQDYRDVSDGPFDAISSIGMFEHVGLAKVSAYIGTLASLLRPQGRLLNHAIARPEGDSEPIEPRSFMGRYVFPDGELLEVGRVVSAIDDCGLEVRDVESLREHYGRTLRCWVANLEANWSEAVRLVGEERARVWRLYMAASAVNFERARTTIHQVLAVRPDDDGSSGMPLTRTWVTPGQLTSA